MHFKLLNLLTLLILPIIVLSQLEFLEYQTPKLTIEVSKLATKIGKSNTIHSETIGYSGDKSNQYKNFEKLISTARIDELVQLMNHPKSAVRGYAFWALAKKHFINLNEIFIKHANDDETVILMLGCMVDEISVIDFMKLIVTPEMIDLNCKKLDHNIIEKMEKNKTKIRNSKNE